jgi:hypothetical protein
MRIAAQGRTLIKKAPAAKKVSAAIPESKIDLSEYAAPTPENTMAGAYKIGVLPAFAPMPESTEQDHAALLAEAISMRDGNSTGALMTALKAAGYGIRDKEGNVDFNRKGWQGLALEAWEIAMIAKLYGDGWGVGLGRFGDALEKISPKLKKESNTADIVGAIRAASLSQNEATRFWADIIIELGLRADVPYDLRLDEDVKHARLDAVQLALILTRFAADLNFHAKRAPQPVSAVEQYKLDKERGIQRVYGASTMPGIEEEMPPIAMPGEGEPVPCSKTELEQLILDLNASGMGIVFGKLIEHLEDVKNVPKTPGQILGAANAAFILLKLVMTYAALEAEFAMDGNILTRTKTTQDGERKLMTAKVKLDIGKWQIVNCLRPMLNASGIDFSLPGDGALSGVRVDWNLLEGGRTQGNIRQAGNGGNVESDQIVYIDNQSTAEPDDRGKHYNYTDKDGISKVYAVGYRQPRDLSRLNLRPIIKPMSVDLDIQVKTMKISDRTGAIGTANDLAGNAMAFLNGDVLGGVVGTAAETIYRSNLGSSKAHTFPVKDWVPCDGGWRGTITYKRVLFNRARSERRQSKLMDDVKYFSVFRDVDLYDARITVGPGQTPTTVVANAQVTYRRVYSDYQKADRITTCGNRGNALRPASMISNDIRSYKAAVSDSCSLDLFVKGDGTVNISFDLPDAAGEFVSSSNSHYTGGCFQDPPTNVNQQKPLTIDGARYTIESAPLDRDNPYILRGSRKVIDKDGRGMIVSWDLSRCS